ncbi:MAG TPA: hypothetical protein VG842_12715 [Sediminibacterium sp.]|nr:hypothetical protein [Sediminibacterium sp.]
MKAARQLTIALLTVISLSALYIGYQLITDPTGASLGLPFYLLNGTLLTSYAVMGWIMVFTLGLLSALILVLILTKSRYYSFMTIVQGVIACLVIFLQWLLLNETFALQYVYLIMGITLIGLGILQYQRRIAYETEGKQVRPAPKSRHHKHRRKK